jgi:hypothetical protein
MRIEAVLSIPSRAADYWDGQRRETEMLLNEGLGSWVQESPTKTRVVLATVAHTAVVAPMWLAQGFVDILRLGQGVKKGGAGYVEDGLRVLAIAGPTMRVLGKAGGGLKWLLTDPGGGRCSWVAGTAALRMSGVKHYATVKDLATAAGITVKKTSPAYLTEIAELLRKLGAKAEFVGARWGGRTVEENLTAALKSHPNSVATFDVYWAEKGQQVGHAMVARLNASGVLEILDRPGHGEGAIYIAKSLSALGSRYGSIGSGQLGDILVVNGGIAVTEPLPRMAVAAATAGPIIGVESMILLEVKAVVVEQTNDGRR